MNLVDTIKNLFKKDAPVIPVVEEMPKAIISKYQQDFSVYDSFHEKHREHQKKALKHLQVESIGQISLPTGTGKTRVQVDIHIADMIDKTKKGESGVYVIGAHRLALCSQLLYDIVEVAMPCGINFDILYVGSERFNNDKIRTRMRSNGDIHDNLRAFDDKISRGINTTRQDEVVTFVNEAKANNRHVIAVATYHSFHKLSLLPKIDICTYDEAHITVGDDFSGNIALVKPVIEKNFFFTATRKVIGSHSGMNNTELYGDVLYSVAPRTMIEAGEIVAPLLHSIKISDDSETGNFDNSKMLFKTIKEGFTQHRIKIKHHSAVPEKIGAKLLISCSGSDELREILASEELKQWCNENSIKVLSFSSNPDVGYHFNFEKTTRSELFDIMEDLKDEEDAILMHIDILTEGIDLPSITGVMPLRNLNQSKLIQTVGRATRLVRADRTRLYSGALLPQQKTHFIKPYCWFLVPQLFSSLGDYNQMLRLLREIMNTYQMKPEEFSSADRFLAETDVVLPKVTEGDTVAKREKECNLKHVFEDIYLAEFQEEMGELSDEEKFSLIREELLAYNA